MWLGRLSHPEDIEHAQSPHPLTPHHPLAVLTPSCDRSPLLAPPQNTSEPGATGRRMLLGLFGEEDVLSALASAEVSHASGLVVSRLAMYPAELNHEDSTASLRMVHALHLLADAIDTPLDLGEHADEWDRRLEEASGRAVDDMGDST